MSYTALKVPVRRVADFSHKDWVRMRQHSIDRIKKYILRHPRTTHEKLIERHIASAAFIQNNAVCVKCGHVEEKSAWAMAASAAGGKTVFQCDCGNNFFV